jgi:hypothetical protein
LHSGELHKLYSSPDIIREGKWQAWGRGETWTRLWRGKKDQS